MKPPPADVQDERLYVLSQEAFALVAKLFAAGRQDLADALQPIATTAWMASIGKGPRS